MILFVQSSHARVFGQRFSVGGVATLAPDADQQVENPSADIVPAYFPSSSLFSGHWERLWFSAFLDRKNCKIQTFITSPPAPAAVASSGAGIIKLSITRSPASG